MKPLEQRRTSPHVLRAAAALLVTLGVLGPLAASADAPAPRYGHAAILDTLRVRMLMFGGQTASGVSDEFWSLSLAGDMTWQVLPPVTPGPRRTLHSTILDPIRDRVLVFGGHDGLERKNDVWVCTLSGSAEWSQLPVAGTPPVPRDQQSAIYDPVRDRMIVFGGYNNLYWNDVWALSLSGTPTWTQLQPTGTSPAPRAAASAVYDPVRDRMIVFGGGDAGSQFGDVWAMNLGGSPTWTHLQPSGAGPLARKAQSAVYDPARDGIWLFGGGSPSTRSDVWTLSLNGTPTWSLVTPRATTPPARIFHSAILYPATDQMVVFGGWGPGFFNDTWALQLGKLPSWLPSDSLASAPAHPIPIFTGPVAASASTIDLGQTFTFTVPVRNAGFESDDGRINVSFPALINPLDGQWVESSTSGDAAAIIVLPAGSSLPSPTCQTALTSYLAVEYRDGDWLGGSHEAHDLALTVQPREAGTFYFYVRSTMRASGTPCTYTNAVPDGGSPTLDQRGWQVTRYAVEVLPVTTGPPTTTWSILTPPAGGPGPRFSSSMVYHPGRDALVLYGGSDAPYNYLTDAWALPLAPGGSWTALTPGGPIPNSRIHQSMILNPIEDHLVVFGGFHDVALNDLTALALSPLVWWFPATPSGPQPSPRFGQSAVYDPLRHRMLVIGGYGDAYFNEVWEYPLPGNGTWTQLYPSGTPMPPRTQHAAVYDPVRDRVLIFGGEGGLFLNDVWELTLGGTLAWNQIFPSGQLPVGRREHTMIYDPARDRLVVFGGWHLGARLNDVWALSLTGPPAWTQLFSSTAPPSPRMEHAALYDPVRDQMVVFGGDVGTNQFTNELWALGFDTSPTQVPPGGRGVSHGLALAGASPNPVRDNMWVAFSLPDEDRATLELFDLNGRLLETQEVGALGIGVHRVALSESRRLPAGVYLVRLVRADRTLTAKACVVR